MSSATADTRDERLLQAHGVDTVNGGTYEFPDGTKRYLRPLYGLRDFPFEGDLSAYLPYWWLRCDEYSAMTDAIREHHSKVWAKAFSRAVRGVHA